ncbi:MAG: PAS domain-containing protein [Microscillaceae bacterium]|nr:PAS domain-containing protein [Microscillaceae bacterium]
MDKLEENHQANSSGGKFLDKYFSIYTIRGRTNLIVFTSLVALMIITVFVLFQNYRTETINERIKNTRTEIPVAALAILSDINYILHLQSLQIKDPSINQYESQEQIWQNNLLTNFAHLEKTRNHLMEQPNRVTLDSLEWLLEDFRASYREIHQLLEATNLKQQIFSGNTDSLGRLEHKNIETLQAQIDKIIREKQSPTYEKLKFYLNILKDAEMPLLQSDIDRINKTIRSTNLWATGIALAAFAFLTFLAFRTNKQLGISIQKPVEMIQSLAKGDLRKFEENTPDELGIILEAGKELCQNLEKAGNFANEIGEGNFKSDFSPASEKDILGNALLQMRDKLLFVSEEDKKREWVSQGLAKFSEILRSHNEDFKEFSNKVISNLVRYLKANQGGIFILGEPEEEGKFLELTACYAYDRQKFLKKKIFIGSDFAEGLIGQAFLEKESIYLTNVPDDHLHIVSGLGDGSPRALLIVPLKLNDEVEGVLELASFDEFEAYKIEFVERLAQSITSSIISVKTNNKTRQLLAETQKQAEELRSQEEEMRQNNEELAATQEEMRRKSFELERLLLESTQKEEEKTQALTIARHNEELLRAKNEEIAASEEELRQNMEELQSTQDNVRESERRLFRFMDSIPAGVVVLDKEGKTYFINDYAFNILGIPAEAQESRQESLFEEILQLGKNQKYPPDLFPLNLALKGSSTTVEDLELRLHSDQPTYLEMTAQPIFNQHQEIEYAIAIFRNITERKLKDAEIQKQNAVFANARDVILIFEKGKVIDYNQASLDLFQTNDKNILLGKSIVDLTPNLKSPEKSLEEIIDGYMSICLKKGSYFFEWKLKNFQNKDFNCEILLSSIPFHERTLVAASIRDITERKLKDLAIHKKNQVLKEQTQQLGLAQEEALKREDALSLAHEKLAANEAILKKAFAKSKNIEQTLKLQLKEKEAEIEALKLKLSTTSNGSHNNVS